MHFDPAIPDSDLDLLYFITGLYQFDRHRRVLAELESHSDRLSRHETLRPWVLRMRAFCRFKVGRYVEALTDLAQQREIADDETWALQAIDGVRDMAKIEVDRRRERGAWAEVLELGEALLSVSPSWPELERGMAIAHDMQGRPERAEAMLRDIVRREPLYEWAWQSLAVVLSSRGRTSETFAVVERTREVFLAAGREQPDFATEWLKSIEPADEQV